MNLASASAMSCQLPGLRCSSLCNASQSRIICAPVFMGRLLKVREARRPSSARETDDQKCEPHLGIEHVRMEQKSALYSANLPSPTSVFPLQLRPRKEMQVADR